jgi:hypothetical protein
MPESARIISPRFRRSFRCSTATSIYRDILHYPKHIRFDLRDNSVSEPTNSSRQGKGRAAMPAFAFWNTYRLGGGSGEAKRIIIEGVLAQIFDSHQAEFAILCEGTGDVHLGDAPVSRQLYTASRRHGQLAYSAFDDDLSAHDLERADINDLIDVFGQTPYKRWWKVQQAEQASRSVRSTFARARLITMHTSALPTEVTPITRKAAS